jgi:hypothetical protein
MNSSTARQVLKVVPSWLAGMAISTPIIAVLQGAILLQGQYTEDNIRLYVLNDFYAFYTCLLLVQLILCFAAFC